MSARTRRHIDFLRKLFKARPSRRRVILQQSSDDELLTLCELAYNVLHGAIPLTDEQVRRLKKNRRGIKHFADRRVALTQKRKKIRQTGGFVLPLLSVALPFLTTLLTSGRG